MKNKENRIWIFGAFIVALLVMNFVTGDHRSIGDWLIDKIMILPGIFIGLSFHEFGHAWMSDKLGDPTPRQDGRVTINPRAHVDIFGFICLIFVGFGWGVPVRIDNRYYKKPRRDEFLVSIAGVVMNLVIAVVFAFIMRFMLGSSMAMSSIGMLMLKIISYVVQINIVLMIFNLIPCPPLDGFGIATQIFNLRRYDWYETVYNNGFFILMILLIFNIVDLILQPGIQFVWSGLLKLIVY